MRFNWAVLLAILPAAAVCQQAPRLPEQSRSSSDAVVYDLGPEITAPQLTPELAPFISDKDCEGSYHGKTTLNMGVDAAGMPSYFYLTDATGDDLDKLALIIIKGDRFNPATRNGSPVAIRQSVELSIEGCIEYSVDNSGNRASSLRLKTQPTQTFGHFREPHYKNFSNAGQLYHGVSAPIPFLTPSAVLTDEALRKKVNEICLVSLVVNEHGMPQNPKVVKPIGYGLDESALRAIQSYRFVPAVRDGKPISVQMSIEVAFRTLSPSHTADHRQ
jgi:TonB family protein